MILGVPSLNNFLSTELSGSSVMGAWVGIGAGGSWLGCGLGRPVGCSSALGLWLWLQPLGFLGTYPPLATWALTDTKLIVNLELREEFTSWKKPRSFMITRAKLSAVGANSFVIVEQFTTFSQFWCHCLRIGGVAFIRGHAYLLFCPRCGAYSKVVLIRVNKVSVQMAVISTLCTSQKIS